ncbi:MAG TPA: hypothetical protein VLD67_00125 [Vicinamibacterales bacterium]|nr:hypothetical protein [Vicinamibacterales bacterium]
MNGIVVACMVTLASPAGAQAQQAQDDWTVTIAPYLMGAGMNGTTGIGPVESDVDLSASDIFKNLKFGFMGYFEVKKGKWGAGADIIWMSLASETGDLVPIEVEADQGGFTLIGLRRLGAAADLRFGAVINTLRPAITIGAPINVRRSRTETWVDPVVGVKLHTPDTGGRFGFALMADVGGFGVGSDIMVNLQPAVAIRVARSVGLAFGYRWIYIDYENEGDDDQRRFLYDMMSSGPFVGLVFRF